MSKEVTVNVNVNSASDKPQHVQLSGQAFFDEDRFSFFVPNNPRTSLLPGIIRRGRLQQLTDGTIDFVVTPWSRTRSRLLRKVAHGRLSQTVAGAVRLTLEVGCNEGLDVAETMRREAAEAVRGII